MSRFKRPHYETKAMRAQEAEIAEELGQIWGVRCFQRPPGDRIDLDLYTLKGKHWGYAEIRRRSDPWATYEYMVASKEKFEHVCHKVASEKKPVFYVAVVPDQWHYAFFWGDYKIAPGGRRDRGDPYDVGLLVWIPVRYFRRIK